MIIRGKRPFKQRTKQGLTIAPMRSGAFMLRVKSSLTAQRVKTDPAFKPLMADAALMKVASPLASRVYREVGKKDVRLYRKLVGRVKGMLKKGMQECAIEEQLKNELLSNKRKKRVSLRVIPYRDFPVFYVGESRTFITVECRHAAVLNTS